MSCKICEHGFESQCRRYPPTFHGFPIVSDETWCGEFRLAEQFKQKPAIEAQKTPEKPEKMTAWADNTGKPIATISKKGAKKSWRRSKSKKL